jgi:hypothetical protein
MNAGARLGVYAAGLALAFAAAFGIAGVVVPDSVVAHWKQSAADGHGAHDAAPVTTATQQTYGLSVSASGHVLSPVSAPAAAGEAGELAFQILGPDGAPVTAYTTGHEKDLHLIVVRTDGSLFRHVHPTLDVETGTWSTEWEWEQAGTYRVFADFVTAGSDATGVTLSRLVEVEGDFSPVQAHPHASHEVDGFTVALEGDLQAGAGSELTVTITRDDQPVTTLEPYLGAFGHLVALREGDLAYVHVHADGEDPRPGDTAGPTIGFHTEAPSSGRYFLYLDFQVDGQVRTAQFVLDAAAGTVASHVTNATPTSDSSPAGSHGDDH